MSEQIEIEMNPIPNSEIPSYNSLLELLENIKTSIVENRKTKASLARKDKFSSILTTTLYSVIGISGFIGANSTFDKNAKAIFLLVSGSLNLVNVGISTLIKNYKFGDKVLMINTTTSLLLNLKNRLNATLIRNGMTKEEYNMCLERFNNEYNLVLDLYNDVF